MSEYKTFFLKICDLLDFKRNSNKSFQPPNLRFIKPQFLKKFGLELNLVTLANKEFYTLTNEEHNIVWLYDAYTGKELPEESHTKSIVEISEVSQGLIINVTTDDKKQYYVYTKIYHYFHLIYTSESPNGSMSIYAEALDHMYMVSFETTKDGSNFSFFSKEIGVPELHNQHGSIFLRPVAYPTLFTSDVKNDFKKAFNLVFDVKTFSKKSFLTLTTNKGDIVWLYDAVHHKELPESSLENSFLKINEAGGEIVIEVYPYDESNQYCSVYKYCDGQFDYCCKYNRAYHSELNDFYGYISLNIYDKKNKECAFLNVKTNEFFDYDKL